MSLRVIRQASVHIIVFWWRTGPYDPQCHELFVIYCASLPIGNSFPLYTMNSKNIYYCYYFLILCIMSVLTNRQLFSPLCTCSILSLVETLDWTVQEFVIYIVFGYVKDLKFYYANRWFMSNKRVFFIIIFLLRQSVLGVPDLS